MPGSRRAGARNYKRLSEFSRSSGKSDLEATFLYYWHIVAPDLPEPETQYKFHPKRRWRLDFAWPDFRLSVEVNGTGGGGYGNPVVCHVCGARVRARLKGGALGKELRLNDPSHASADGQARDAEKQNAMIALGWRPMIFTSKMLHDDPAGCIEQVASLIRLDI